MTTPTQSQPVHPAAEEAVSQGYEQQLFSLGCEIEFILSDSVFSLAIFSFSVCRQQTSFLPSYDFEG